MPEDDANPMQTFNANVIEEFRTNGGKVTGPFEKAPLLLLNTTGAKSGQPRTNPLVYTRDGDRLVIIASKGGSPAHPDWYHNLKAHPQVSIELPGEKYDATATEATGAERDRLFRQQADLMPHFDEYQARTERRIPVFILERNG